MITAIVQARMGSTRLPGKVLIDIQGKPLLEHVMDRVGMTRLIDRIVIATTVNEKDKAVIEFAKNLSIPYYVGSEDDVLDRFYQAARKFGANIIVRITPDCPMIDPHVIDEVIERYLKGDYDYVANTLKRTYPDGLDVEVFSYKALEKAWKEARWFSEREHVTPYIWKNPDKFRLSTVESEVNLSHLRWTVDEESDLQFVREVYRHIYKEGDIFYMEDVLNLLAKHPELKQINQGIATNEGYAKSLREDKIVR